MLNKRTLLTLTLLILLAAAVALPRLPDLGTTTTADEPEDLIQSANFYYAVKEGLYERTLRFAHPGVTMLWAGAASMQLNFPDYTDYGIQGVADLHFRELLVEKNLPHTRLLATGRAVIIAQHTALLCLAFLLARKLFGIWPAFFTILLAAFDPFFFALSRLLHHDGLLASAMLVSLLAFLVYLKEKRRAYLLLAGAAAGFSLLTKTPAVLLAPAILAVIALHWRLNPEQYQGKPGSHLLAHGKSLLWLGLAGLVVFVLLWPAIWVQPLATLQRMVQYTAESSSGVHTSSMFYNGQVIPDGQIDLAYPFFYPVTVLWRTTPLVLVGLVLAALALLPAAGDNLVKKYRFEVFSLLAFMVIFTFFMTLTTKKFDRYLIPVYPPLDMLAALGWLAFAGWLAQRVKGLQFALTGALAALVVLGFQILPLVQTAPTYLSYYNPLMGGARKAPQVMMVGWGEGLDLAAQYLNQKPNVHELKVYAWYSRAFDFYFDGVSDEIPFTSPLPDSTLDELLQADYLVVYVHQRQRDIPTNLLEVLEPLQPEHTITIGQIEYVRIYNLND